MKIEEIDDIHTVWILEIELVFYKAESCSKFVLNGLKICLRINVDKLVSFVQIPEFHQ